MVDDTNSVMDEARRAADARIAELSAFAQAQVEELIGYQMTLDELRSALEEGCPERISDGQLLSLRYERGLTMQLSAMSLMFGDGVLPKGVEDQLGLGFVAQLSRHEWELLDAEYKRRQPPLEEQIADLEKELLCLDEDLEEELEETRTRFEEKRVQLEVECARLKEKQSEG